MSSGECVLISLIKRETQLTGEKLVLIAGSISQRRTNALFFLQSDRWPLVRVPKDGESLPLLDLLVGYVLNLYSFDLRSIGSKFAQTEMRVFLLALIPRFCFRVSVANVSESRGPVFDPNMTYSAPTIR